jgi:hypothetical protein
MARVTEQKAREASIATQRKEWARIVDHASDDDGRDLRPNRVLRTSGATIDGDRVDRAGQLAHRAALHRYRGVKRNQW